MGAAFVLVFLDPVLSFSASNLKKYWLHAFSPVCWTSVECINILGSRFFISIPFVTVTSLVVISILIILIALFSRKIMVEAREG